jgi:hypothetical protein
MRTLHRGHHSPTASACGFYRATHRVPHVHE